MRSIGRLADVAGSRHTDPDPQPTEAERITALERRVSTLELLLNDVMHQLDQPSQTSAPPKKSASTPKTHKPAPKPQQKQSKPKQQKPTKPKKPKQPQPWDNPQRLAEITELGNRILASEKNDFTKAAVVSQFQVNTKLAGQTLAWLVSTGKMKMHTPEPTQADPDPKKIFSIRTAYSHVESEA